MQLNAIDPRALGQLRNQMVAGRNGDANQMVARQFEALFIQMVVESMRKTSFGGSIGDSEQTKLFQSMHDQQLALSMAGQKGIGIAEAILRQIERTGAGAEPAVQEISGAASGVTSPSNIIALPSMPARTPVDMPSAPGRLIKKATSVHFDQIAPHVAASADARATMIEDVRFNGPGRTRQARFVNALTGHAREASERTGVPDKFMIAQAALETGWGRGELLRRDGSPSHNLFNIKAGSSWNGDVVETKTTEYIDGRMVTVKARFRAYDSYTEGFRDYASLLVNNPRYANVVGSRTAEAFAENLQRAGYATDPEYAAKIKRIISQLQ